MSSSKEEPMDFGFETADDELFFEMCQDGLFDAVNPESVPESEILEWKARYWSAQILKMVLQNEFLDKTSCLQSRLVCRHWNKATLKYIQGHPSHLELNDMKKIGIRKNIQRKEPWQAALQRDWFTPKNIISSWNKLKPICPLESNPFLSSGITISDKHLRKEDSSMWFSKISVLLNLVGDRVRYCSIEFCSEVNDLLHRYLYLHECIESMPRLEMLQVVFRNHPTSEGWKGMKSILMSKGITPHPLSELEHLKVLKTVNLPHLIFNEIIGKVRKEKLCKLKIFSESTMIVDCWRIHMDRYDLEQLSNVTEASIRLQKRDFEKLEESMMKGMWPLGRLHIHLDFGWTKRAFPVGKWWGRIFSFLETKFGSSLTHLGLVLPEACNISRESRKALLEDSLAFRLNLPGLNELRMEVTNITSLDFLLPMKSSLEVIVLHFNCIDYSSVALKKLKLLGERQIIKLDPRKAFLKNGMDGNQDHPLQSNIWKEFPKLRKLTLQFSSCFVMDELTRKYIGGRRASFKCIYDRKHDGNIMKV